MIEKLGDIIHKKQQQKIKKITKIKKIKKVLTKLKKYDIIQL